MSVPRLRTLLVVDDEADMLENIARILGRNRYRCLQATSAQAALGLLEREHPDLLLTDLRMPGTDGLALLRQVRRLSPGLPVVIITAFATDAGAREAREAGAAGYLAKPFTARELLLAIDQAIGTSEGGSEAGPPAIRTSC
jgi:CheY-like chemotaxis protein